MIMSDNISINTAIIHRLDNQSEDGLEKSDFILDLNNEIKSVLARHSSSSLNDKKIRYAKFNDYDTNLVFNLTSKYLIGESDFIKYSHRIAEKLFSHMTSKTISPGDLVIVDSNIDGEQYIVILKLDYKDQYLSEVEYINDKKKITLVKNDNAWPEEGTRLQKAAFIRLNIETKDESSYDLVMLDRQYTQKGIEDEGTSIFFSKSFLNTSLIEDERHNTTAFIRGAKALKDEYSQLDITPEEAHDIYNHALSLMTRSENINIETFAGSFFDPEEGKSEQFEKVKEIFKEAGLTRNEFSKSSEVANAYLRNRRIVLDGVRLIVDNSVYEDNDKFSYNEYFGADGKKLVDISIKGVELKKME